MGRRKLIYVDEMTLLAAIAQETQEAIAFYTKEAKRLEREYTNEHGGMSYSDSLEIQSLEYAVEQIKADGVDYDLEMFAGRTLTPSERIRHQEAIRRLSERGYVELYGARATRVKVLPAGYRALKGKPEPAINNTNL
jgi:hypothetical protein